MIRPNVTAHVRLLVALHPHRPQHRHQMDVLGASLADVARLKSGCPTGVGTPEKITRIEFWSHESKSLPTLRSRTPVPASPTRAAPERSTCRAVRASARAGLHQMRGHGPHLGRRVWLVLNSEPESRNSSSNACSAIWFSSALSAEWIARVSSEAVHRSILAAIIERSCVWRLDVSPGRTRVAEAYQWFLPNGPWSSTRRKVNSR
jgi:hypothetical protein